MNQAGGEQCANLGRKGQRVPGYGIVQWLDAESVTGAEDRAPALVHDDEGEHSVEMRQAITAPLFVGMCNDLCIASANERVSGIMQFFPEFNIIEYLAVEYNRDIVIRTLQWLV